MLIATLCAGLWSPTEIRKQDLEVEQCEKILLQEGDYRGRPYGKGVFGENSALEQE